jgi:peptide/nickel transport system substrate-binding protein
VGSVTFRHMPEAATRVAALEAGEVDIAYAVPPEVLDRLRGRGFVIASTNIGQIININLSSLPGTPMADKRVRQALNLAVDKDEILKTIMGGFGRKLDAQLVGPDAFGYNPKLRPYPYDPTEARRLLTAAGYAGGFEVPFIGTEGRYPKDKEIAEAVVGYLGRIGVRAKLQILESGVWLSKLYVKGAMGPMWMSGWMYMPAMDAQLPMTFFQCDSVVWVMCNSEFDRLFREASITTDHRRREQLLFRLSEIIREEAPIIFLHQIPAVFGVSPRVKGLKLLADWSFDISKLAVATR